MKTEELVAGLRQLADFYEDRPDLPMPSTVEVVVTSFDKEESHELVSRIARQLGTFTKDISGDLLTLRKDFGPETSLRFLFYRSKVCVRKVVGTHTVEKEVYPSNVTPVIEMVEEDIVEWDCPPLLKPQEEAQDDDLGPEPTAEVDLDDEIPPLI